MIDLDLLKIRPWMAAHYKEFISPRTGELNCTTLAEACAHALGHDEWLDQEFHEVWEIALEFDGRVM